MSVSLSLRARLTVWYTVALLIVLALGGATVLWQQGRIGLARVDRQLQDLTATLANLMQDELTEDPVLATAAQDVQATIIAPGRAVAILDRAGHPVATGWNGLNLSVPLPAFDDGVRVWTAATATGAWRVRTQPTTVEQESLVLLTAAPLADVFRERREVQEAMWVGFPIVLLVASLGGWWLASLGLRPITKMAERAARIPLTGDQDLGESNRTDELGRLARAFNGLVARLRAALQTQRQFMADASHELRTPVSVIRSASDVTLGRGHRDETEYREALSIVGSEARRLGRLVEDMLVLARADAGGYPLQPVTLYLDELIAECRRTLDVLAAGRDVTVRVTSSPEIPFVGDEHLLKRMLVNLGQNAVHHTRQGGAVSISVSNGLAIAIDVTDQGSGVAAEDRERIFDRFVQLDRARQGSGSGLGLPIARWIAEAHGGTLTLASSGPAGSTFRVVLPMPGGPSQS
jgi:two-component system, OmpR family, sensor kinase